MAKGNRRKKEEIVSVKDILIKEGKSVLKIEGRGLADFKIVNTSIHDDEGNPLEYQFELKRKEAVLFYYLFMNRPWHVSKDDLSYVSNSQRVKSAEWKEKVSDIKKNEIVEEFDKELKALISRNMALPESVVENERGLQRNPFGTQSFHFNEAIVNRLFPRDKLKDEEKRYALAVVFNCFKKYKGGRYYFQNVYDDKGTKIIPFDIEKAPAFVFSDTNTKDSAIEVYGIRDIDQLLEDENLDTVANSIIDIYKPNITIGADEPVKFDAATAMTALGDTYDIALLTGRVGSGKTTFLKNIIAQQYSGLKEWYINAKYDIRGQNGSIFDCILGYYAKNKNDGSQGKRIAEAINSIDQHVLIMVDNYDSLNVDETEDVIRSLKAIHRKCRGKVRTIIAAPYINISAINDAFNLEHGKKNQFRIIEIQMQPLKSDSIKNGGIYISDPTPLQAIVANSIGLSDNHVINGTFELYDSFYNAVLADQSERVKKYAEYVAWRIMNVEDDGWPELNEASKDFPCVFRGMNLPLTEDNFFNFLRNRRLVSFKESNGVINENEIRFEDVEGQCYLASHLIADELCRGGWKEVQKIHDIVNKLHSFTIEEVINSSMHIYGEYLFRELCKRNHNVDRFTKECILRLGLASGYYSKNDLLSEILPLVENYMRDTAKTGDIDLEILSEINDYLYEILTRTIINEKSDNIRLRRKALNEKLHRAKNIEEVFLKLADRVFESIFGERQITTAGKSVIELCEGNGSLGKIASDIRDGNYNYKLVDYNNNDNSDRIGITLDEDTATICTSVTEALKVNSNDIMHTKVSLLAILYGNVGAACLEIGTRCGIENDDALKWIGRAERYHEMGRILRMASTGSIARSYICLGTDNYYLSKKGNVEGKEFNLKKAEEFAENAIKYALASENMIIKDERIECGSVGKAIKKARESYLNDDVVIACKNRLGCIYEIGHDNYTDAVQVSKALIDTNECIEKYCEQKGNHIAFIQAPVEDLIKRTAEEFLPFLESQESRMKSRIGLSKSSRPKEGIEVNRIRSSLEKLCEKYNELRVQDPISLDISGKNIGTLKNY